MIIRRYLQMQKEKRKESREEGGGEFDREGRSVGGRYFSLEYFFGREIQRCRGFPLKVSRIKSSANWIIFSPRVYRLAHKSYRYFTVAIFLSLLGKRSEKLSSFDYIIYYSLLFFRKKKTFGKAKRSLNRWENNLKENLIKSARIWYRNNENLLLGRCEICFH